MAGWSLNELGRPRDLAHARGPLSQLWPALAAGAASATAEVRATAVHAFGRLGQPSPGALELLERVAGDASAPVRRAALRSLTTLFPTDPRTLAALRRALRDPDAEVREKACWCLPQLRHDAAAALGDLLELCGREGDGDCAALVSRLLSMHVYLDVHLPAILSLVASDSADLCRLGLRLLLHTRVPSGQAQRAVAARLDHPDPRLPRQALGAIEHVGLDLLELREALPRRLRDRNVFVRREAASCCWGLARTEWSGRLDGEALEGALADPDFETRVHAALAFLRLGRLTERVQAVLREAAWPESVFNQRVLDMLRQAGVDAAAVGMSAPAE